MSHFNDQAQEWDDEGKIKLMATLAQKTLQVLKLREPIDMMDFGCGTGLFGLEFADFAKSLVGIDTSEGMLDVFIKKTADANHITSILVDLEKEDCDQTFDLIVSSMAFHHLNNPQKLLGKLKTMLKPGGKIAIVDLDKEDGSFHPDNDAMGVKHFGFAKEEILDWADATELLIDYRIINTLEKDDKKYQQFLAVFS